MEKVNMSQQDFANKLGISPASLSSIFTGRTNPTNNHVQAIHRAFPEINVNWLLFGEGDMLVSGAKDMSDLPADATGKSGDNESGDAASAPKSMPEATLFHLEEPVRGAAPAGRHHVAPTPARSAYNPPSEYVKIIDKPTRKVKEIRVFFDDGTYETFVPSTK